MPKGLLVAFSNPLAGQEDAYNVWFGTLVQEALAVPGILTAQRYRLASPSSRRGGGRQPVPRALRPRGGFRGDRR